MAWCLLVVVCARVPSVAATDPPAFLYMGKHKEENEDLIAYGLPEDIW